jgi:hypothetical protein
MKVDVDPFPVGIIDLGEKKVLIQTDQARTAAGKIVIMSDEFRNQTVKPRNPETRVRKENVSKKPTHKVIPTSSMLIEKYVWMQQQQQVLRGQWSGLKRSRSPASHCQLKSWEGSYSWERPRFSAFQGKFALARDAAFGDHRRGRGADDVAPVDHLSPGTKRESHAILLCGGDEGQNDVVGIDPARVVMVGAIPCRL